MPVQKLLAKIHIAKKELGLDDETYREVLNSECGVRSVECEIVEQLSERIKELEGELDNETKWAKEYFDKWEKAESEREHLSKEVIKERIKVVALTDAIDKHEKFKRSHEKVVSLQDEELYSTRKEEKS
jgi:hypothetical protein